MEAKMERGFGSGIVLVEPDSELVRSTELQIEDGLVEPDEAGRVLLLVRNDSPSPQLLSAAWKIAKGEIEIAKAQKRQKVQYDKRSRSEGYCVGGRVMVFMPQEAQGKGRKLALPYHGPYRILEVRSNCLLVRPVDHPNDQPILASMDRVVGCPNELGDESWLGPRQKWHRQQRKKQTSTPEATMQSRYSLRSRT